MYAEFKKEKWDKMNWLIYSAYHGEEIKRKKMKGKNKDKILEQNRQYREENKDKIKEMQQLLDQSATTKA